MISADGLYRYRLTRYWDFQKPTLSFVMLNPSTADGEHDDNTIIKCVKYARRWGYGGLMVCNAFAWRATDPRQLLTAPDPVGPENDRHLSLMFQMASGARAAVIAAWGANVAKINEGRRAVDLLALPLATERLYCLGINADGSPKHPLYQKDDAEIHQYGRAA